ncbi:putative flavoprotein involved in K+ transport [Frankia torreyi]|uniref:Putative flavoprotein involved in K+ transport n=1 Tax=Frankia torreyi TaxID=1856 RepID=A0A0D8BCN9_9ACTN|nr:MULTISPECIES: NAD(P)/FAD-dependent oxidoreductase [Frankia]KJE21825.1 putative flavoprotein involved in K+ transport [Frankia torreyi]KQM03966.1 putative flavoprotein involved in K+ transport [Frankia sp. CpI1-P]
MLTGDLEDLDVLIVGAGFAGMYAVHRLRGQGLRVRAYDAADDVGGTWYWNRYPGARCDIESLEYSYSFSEELQQDWEWSRRFPEQPEMLAYARHVADRFDLRRDIVFATRITSVTFDEGDGRWLVTTDRGQRVRARFCVMATGCLSVPNVPDLPGADRFAGRVLHTATWPAEDVDLAGQRVGVVGTGASGIQCIPLIAQVADHLTVFQRSANFSVQGLNVPLDPELARERKAHYGEYRERARRSFGGMLLRQNRVHALTASAEERDREFSARWGLGGFEYMAAFDDLIFDPAANDLAADYVRDKIRQIVRDPEVAATLTPTDHPIGTKRICVDTDYYDTFNRDNVTLVDVRRDPITEITETGVRAGGRVHELDILVYATGFHAMTGALLAMDVRGRGGRRLADHWAHGPRTYLGLGMSGFPNLFVVAGPGSPSVISNAFVSLEQHVDWIGDCLAYLDAHRLTTIEADPAAEDDWVADVNAAAARTLYPQANSWYLGANIPGRPRVFMPYVGGVGRYHKRCAAVAADGYTGFTLSA